MGTGVGEPGVSSQSATMPSTKKRVRPRGYVGSSPNSSSTSNLTCFLSFSSASVGVSSWCDLLLDSWSLGCKLRCSMECLSCSLAGQNHGEAGKGDWHWLGHEGEELWCCLDLFSSLEWECHLNPDCPAGVSLLSQLANSTPGAQLRGLGLWRRMAMGTSPASRKGPSQHSPTL